MRNCLPFCVDEDDDLMSSIAWFTLPLNRAQVVVSNGATLMLASGASVAAAAVTIAVGVDEESTRAALDTLNELFSLLFERLRLKKPVCKKSRFHIESSCAG